VRNETQELRRGIRIDLVIAVGALLISSLATAASWWQSRVVADQLSSQVWPYLSISTTYDPSYVQVDVINDGLGPAIVRSAVLTIDGKPYPNPARALRVLVPKGTRRMSAQLSEISPSSVIRAGGDVRIIRINEGWFVPIFARNVDRIDLKLCYCSLLGKCWQVAIKQNGEPKPVRDCPAVGADQYRVPVFPVTR
jgi:hypothetical protein